VFIDSGSASLDGALLARTADVLAARFKPRS